MKLTSLMILFFTLNVSANGFGQEKISLRAKKTEISGILRSIEKQTNYRFLYNNDLEALREKITINVKEAGLNDVLDLVLGKKGLLYQVMNDNLIVIKIDPSAPIRIPDVVIRGKVTGEGGIALSGVSVQVKGSNAGTTTDNDGNFSLNAPDANVTLVISSIGYDGQEVAVAGRTELTVALVTSTKEMDQVVVVGYGSSSRKDLTAPVGVVNPEDLNKRMTANPMQALQGGATGVQITTNGAPGQSPTVRIRGVGSLNGANPLYVVDGVFLDNIDFLSTNDIGEMSILKDASAAAIYGVRAANGVVIISTKKGKINQKTRVTYNGYVGLQKPTGNFDQASGSEYAAMQLAKLTGTDSIKVLNSVTKFGGSGVNPTTNTDWYAEMLKESAIMHSNSIDLQGGSNKVSYSLGLNYLYQDGVAEGKNSYKRYNIRFQVEAKPFEWLKIGVTTHMSNFTQLNPNVSAFNLAYNASPLYPVYDPTNALATPQKYASSTSLGYSNSTFNNPVAALDYFYDRTKGFQILPTVYAEADIIRNKLSFRTQLSQRYAGNVNQNYLPKFYVDANQKSDQSVLTTTEDKAENYVLDNLLTYKDRRGAHHYSVLLGQSVREERYRSTQTIGRDVPAEQEFWYADQGARSATDYNATGFRNASTSFFGRVSYDYANKYLLTATFRADGSSKYQEKWSYFPSVGLGWVLSEEDFMKNSTIFNFFKIRGSWGQLGNDNVRPNPGYAIVGQGNDYSGIFGSSIGQNGSIIPGYRVNPIYGDIRWEVVTEWDGGIDFTLLKNKLKGSVDYYHRQTSDLAFEASVPFIGDRKYSNWGKVNNSGVEVNLTWSDKVGDLGYSIGGNLSTIKNKVVDLGGLPNLPTGLAEFPTRNVVGQPFNFFYGYEVVGVYQTQAEVDGDPIATANAVKPGYFKYKDQNGDKVLDESDKVNLGSYIPKVSYGFNLNLDYKNFDFGIFFQGVQGNSILNLNRGYRQKFGDINGDQEYVTSLWTGAGSTNEYPSAVASTQSWSNNASSFFVEDGSYLRLQNLQIGYNFKAGKGSNPVDFRVYATADRPVIWSKYSGVTPEIAQPTQLPKERASGSERTPANYLSATGYDNNVYPTTAVYTLGVRVTF